MKKSYIFIIIFSFLMGCLLMIIIKNYGTKADEKSYQNVMWLSIEENRNDAFTYLFVLNSARELEVTVGVKLDDRGIEYADFMNKVYKKAHTKLNKQDYNYLLKMVKDVEKNEKNDSALGICDGEITRLFYNHKTYKGVIPDNGSLWKIRAKMTELCPIKFAMYDWIN